MRDSEKVVRDVMHSAARLVKTVGTQLDAMSHDLARDASAIARAMRAVVATTFEQLRR